ncbi:unnamed protein product, partial [Allacma fusca]
MILYNIPHSYYYSEHRKNKWCFVQNFVKIQKLKVGSILLIISLSWNIYNSSFTRDQLNSILNETQDDIRLQQKIELKFLNYYLTSSAICLILAFLYLVMGGFLLRGIYSKNIHYLQAWIVYTAMSSFILTIQALVIFSVAPSCEIIATTLLFLIFFLTVQGFC